MSRHRFTVGDDTWYVGYDKSLATFFAVRESDIDEDVVDVAGADWDVVDVAGADWDDVTTVDQLERALPETVRLPADVRAAFIAETPTDHATARPGYAFIEQTVMMAMAHSALKPAPGAARTPVPSRATAATSAAAGRSHTEASDEN
jgi:hypothetical protein